MELPRLAKMIEEYNKHRHFPDECVWLRCHEWSLTSALAVVRWETVYYPGKPFLILTLVPHQFGMLSAYPTEEAANAALDEIILIAEHKGKHPHKLNIGYGKIYRYQQHRELRIGQQIVNNDMPPGTVNPELFYMPNARFWTDGLKFVHVIWDEDENGTPINSLRETKT